VLGFKSEIAQILYTYLDLIMARRNYYERKTKELFDDLGLAGEVEYRYPSGRKRQLEKALNELKGVRLTTGVITTIALERTKDGTDYKLIVQKSARASLSVGEHSQDASEQDASESGRQRGAEPQSTAATNALTVQAKELVAHFFKRFHNVETSYPTSKAINQAISLITQYGIDQARHIVDFAHTVAQESNYKPQTFGGILQYTSRALADYEHAKQRSQTAAREREERRRLRAEEELTRQYEDYRSQEIDRLRASLPPEELAAIEQSATAEFNRKDTNPFGRDRMRRLAIEEALAAHGHIPSLAEWKELQTRAPRPERVSYEA
jgi:hypothetical protein